jgi:hypothetical protein
MLKGDMFSIFVLAELTAEACAMSDLPQCQASGSPHQQQPDIPNHSNHHSLTMLLLNNQSLILIS